MATVDHDPTAARRHCGVFRVPDIGVEERGTVPCIVRRIVPVPPERSGNAVQMALTTLRGSVTAAQRAGDDHPG